MKMLEFIDDMTCDGLKCILDYFGKTFSYNKPELKKMVLEIAENHSVSEVLENCYKVELQRICRAHGLPVTGSSDELRMQIAYHTIKKASLEGLAQDIRAWEPEHRYQDEEGYRKDLYRYMTNLGYIVSISGDVDRPDLIADGTIPIEIKHEFSGRDEHDRATGQITRYLLNFGSCIFVVCRYYSDWIDFEQRMGKRLTLLAPEVREKCITILKDPRG